MRKFGPREEPGGVCPACMEEFKIGDFTTLVALGPGGDPDARRRAMMGQAYNAVASEVHWACATGEEEA